MVTRASLLRLAPLTLTGTGACDATPLTPPGGTGFDEPAILEAIADYRAGELVLVNPDPVPSTVAKDRSVRIWVSPPLVAPYQALAHEKPGRSFVGDKTLIVRELVDRDGQVTKLTALAKGPAGSNPEVGDLWFAVTSPTGEPLRDPAGSPQVGALADCSDCHMQRASYGYLWGLSENP